MSSSDSNAQIAQTFLDMVVRGEVDQAYEQYVDMSGKHHNVYNKTGFEALKDAMKVNDVEAPNKQFTIKHVISDGDMVAVHSLLRLKPEMSEMVVVHIFRIVNGKIVELWDLGQEIPTNSPNEDGAF